MPQQAFIFYPGKYYVEYPPDDSVGFEGGPSMCMRYGTAVDYAEIFGGTVHRHPAFPTLIQRLTTLIQRYF